MQKKVVLITGGSKGIGRSMAILFASNNYDVIINYDKSEKEANNLKQELTKITDILLVKADVSNEEDVINMFKEISKKYSKIDVLINNAGIAMDSLIESKSKKDFMRVLEVNQYGPFNVSLKAYPFLDSKSCIINISSTNGIDTYYPYSIDYDSSKAGLISITHNLAKALAPIRVNSIAPGWVITNMNKDLSKEQIDEEEKRILLKRFASPDEIAEVALFLASPKASYINSSVIRVDGGLDV